MDERIREPNAAAVNGATLTFLLLATLLSGCVSSPAPAAVEDSSAMDTSRPRPIDIHASHDFFTGAGDGSFVVPVGAAPSSIAVWFEGTTASLEGAKIEVLDPEGRLVIETAMPKAVIGGAVLGRNYPREETIEAPLPGLWEIKFHGQGAFRGHVELKS